MDKNAGALLRESRTVIGLQILISGLTAAGFFAAKGLWGAQSALYAGTVSVIGTYLLARRIERAGRVAHQNPGKSLRILYIGAAQRFVLLAVLLGLGLVLFKFDPLALVVGLALTQLAFTFGTRVARAREDRAAGD